MLMEFCILVNICNILGPVVQSIVSLTSSLMTNSLTVVAIFKATHIFFSAKTCIFLGRMNTQMYLSYFKREKLTLR